MSGGKTFFSVESGHPYEPIQSQDAKLDDAVSNKSKSLKLIALAGLWLSAAVITALLVINFLYPPQPRLEGTLSPGPAFKLVSHPEPPTSYWGTVSKPYPTGAFWTNLVVKTGDYPVAVLPYGVKTVDAGIQVSYGPTRRSVSQTTISDPFVCDLQFSATQAFVSRSVESYDNISVSVGFHTAGGGKYKTYLVKGSPFVTVTYDGATPVISSSLMRITNVEPRLVKGSTSGSQYIVSLGNYQKWLVYCSPATTLTWQGDSLTSSTAMKGFIRVAILPVQNLEVALSTLLMYVQRYPTGATVSITHPSGTTAQLTYQFTTVGTGPLLMLALPHHVQNMVFPNLMDPAGEGNQAQSYEPVYCIKGKMRPVVGDTWRMQFNLVNVGWNYDLSDKMSTTQLDEIARNLLSDVGSIFPSAVDIYGFGKQLGRMAQLALLADNLGIAEPRQEALSAIEVTLNPWIQDVTQDGLQYDRTYGGVVTAIGITDINTDYGSGWYNDHHFQLGYLVFASAVIARFDVPYFQANKIYLDSIVKDICNPDPTDTDFPFFRHKDLFDFHSWASGLAQQSNGKSQESSSEAVNAYYACYLYGLATANTYLTQASQTMLTMEIIAAQLYWHMPNSNIYDSLFAANVMAGNVGGFDVTASTWFGAKPEYIHGINMMPLSPVTTCLFDQSFIKVEWPIAGHSLPQPVSPAEAACSASPSCVAAGLLGQCCPTNDGQVLGCCSNSATMMSDEWKGYLVALHAGVNRDAAWAQIESMSGFGSGGSKSNSLYWAASRAPPPPGYNDSTRPIAWTQAISPQCSLNSACDASGVTGNCCPSDQSISLGCCPTIV